MKKIDPFLLNLFQKAADTYQEWFGGNNFFLAKTMLVSLWIFVFININIRMHNPENLGRCIWLLLSHFIITMVFLPEILRGEQAVKANSMSKNPVAITLVYTRTIYTVLITILLFIMIILELTLVFFAVKPGPNAHMGIAAEILSMLQNYTLWAFLYFGSCTPKQPTQSKFSKLLEKLSPQPSPI